MSIFDRKYLLGSTGYGGIPGLSAPTLDLNFSTGTLDPRITFTRAGTGATYFDSTGVMQNAAANVPRFDYSPATVTNWVRNNSMAGANTTGSVFPTNWLHGENTTLAPTIVGVGTETGIPYVDMQFSGTAVSGNNNIFFDAGTVIQALTGQTWTHSVYLRIVGGSTANLNQIFVSMQMRDSAGSGLGSFTSNVLASLNGNALAGNRFTLTSALNNASTAFVQPWIQINPQSAAINITLRIGAPQLEQAASAGTLVLTSSGFGGSGGTLRGLLIEEARTNLAFPSADLVTLFTLSGCTLTAAAGTAPDGALTMTRLVESATNASHYTTKVIASITASVNYSVSLFAKAGTRQYLQLYYDDGGANGMQATFDLLAGTISGAATARGTGTATGASIQSMGNGVYRCSITGIAGSATSCRFGAALSTTAVPGLAPIYVGDGTSGLLVWGAQFELGSFAASYIPTVGATVTRAADAATLPLGSWYNATAGSWVADTIGILTASGTPRIVGSQAGPAPLQMVTVSGAGSTYNGSVALISPAISGYAGSARWGMTYAPAGRSVTTNGAAPVTDALGIGAITSIALGSGLGGLNSFLNGTIRRVRYWSQALSATQLMSVTK